MSFWTKSKEDRLRELWADESLLAEDIAQELGCTRNAVLGKRFRLGLPERRAFRELSEEEIAARRSRQLEAVRAWKIANREHYLEQQRKWLRAHRAERRGERPPVKWLTPVPKPQPINPMNVALFDLKSHHCRYITQEGEGGTFFCGQPKAHGTSYCDGHCRIVFTSAGYAATLTRSADRARRAANGYVAQPFRMSPSEYVREEPFA